MVHPAVLTICALCGELANPLLVRRGGEHSFFTLAGQALLFPLQGMGLVGLLSLSLTLAVGLWLGFLGLAVCVGLVLAALFGVARSAGRGGDQLELTDFTNLGSDVVWPLVRFAAATAPAWGCLVVALQTGRPALVWLGAALALVWCPTAFVGAAAGAPLITLLNPLAVWGAISRIGSDVPRLAVALAGLCVLGLMLGLMGALASLLPVPLVSTLVAAACWVYPPYVAARMSGLVLLLHPEPFGWHDSTMQHALLDVGPRGVPPPTAEQRRAHVEPIELPEPEPAPLDAGQTLVARFGGAPEDEPEPAPLPARAAAMAQLELGSLSSHVCALIEEAIAGADQAGALEAFRAAAPADTEALDGEQLLWLGRAAITAGELETAVRALEAAAARRAPSAATAMVLRARLLGERLGRPEEAAALMQQVVTEFAGTKPADFASRWLAGAR